MAYNGNVVVTGPDARNLSSILRDAAAQKSPVLFWNPVTDLWNWQDAAGAKFASAIATPNDYGPALTELRAALDADGVDIP